MDNGNIAIEEIAKIVKSKNPEEANIINSILNMKPKNVTPGQEFLAANMLLLIFETLNNLRINYLGETGEYYRRRLVASYFAIENLNKIGEITKKAIEMETNALASLDPKSNEYALTKQMYGQFHFKMYPYVTVLKQILIYNFEEHVKTNTLLLMFADIFGIPKSEFVSDEDLPEAEIVEEGDETNPMKGGSKFEFLKKNLENIDFQEAIKKYKRFVLLYNCQDADIISFNLMLLMNKALLKPITKGGAKDGEEGAGAGAEEVFDDIGTPNLDSSINKEKTAITNSSPPTTALDFTQQSNVPSTFTRDGKEYSFPLALARSSSTQPSLELAEQVTKSEKAFMEVVTSLSPSKWETIREDEKVNFLANLSHMTSSQVESFTAGASLQLAGYEIGNFDFSNFQISVNTLITTSVASSNYRVLRSFDRNIERNVDVEKTITETDEKGNIILNADGTPKTRIEISKKTVSSPMTLNDIDNQVKQLSDSFDIDVLQETATNSHQTFIDTCKRIGKKYADTTGGLSQLKQITETLSHLDTELTNLEELQKTATELGKQLGVDGVDPEAWVPGTNEVGRRYFQWLGYGSEQQALVDTKIATEQKLTKSSEDFIDNFTKLLTGSDDKGSSMTEYSGESGEITKTTYSPYKFDQDAKVLVSSLNQHYCNTLIPEANYHLISTINTEVDKDGNKKEIVEIGVKFSYEPLSIDGQNIVQKTVYSRAFLIQRLNTMIAAAKEKKEGIAIFQKPEWKTRLDDYNNKKGTISAVIKPLLDNSEPGSLDYIISSASTLVELLQFSPGFKALNGKKTPEVVEKLTLQDMLKINAQLENYQNAFETPNPAKFLEDKQDLEYQNAEAKKIRERANEQTKVAAKNTAEFYENLKNQITAPLKETYTAVTDAAQVVFDDAGKGASGTIRAVGQLGVEAVGAAGGIAMEGSNQTKAVLNSVIFSTEGFIVLILILVLLCAAAGYEPKRLIFMVFGLLNTREKQQIAAAQGDCPVIKDPTSSNQDGRDYIKIMKRYITVNNSCSLANQIINLKKLKELYSNNVPLQELSDTPPDIVNSTNKALKILFDAGKLTPLPVTGGKKKNGSKKKKGRKTKRKTYTKKKKGNSKKHKKKTKVKRNTRRN